MTKEEIERRLEIGWKSLSDYDRTYLVRVLAMLREQGLEISERGKAATDK